MGKKDVDHVSQRYSYRNMQDMQFARNSWCNRCCRGPTGPVGPTGPMGPPGDAAAMSGIIPYSAGYDMSIPCNYTGDLSEILTALVMGFGFSTLLDIRHPDGYAFNAVGFVAPRNITIRSLSAQIIIGGTQLVEVPETVYAALYRYDPGSHGLLPIGVETSIQLMPGELDAGNLLANSVDGLSVPVPMNTKIIMAMYLVSDQPSCLFGAISGGVGYI